MKATLPESQTDTGGSHSLPIPDKEQFPRETHSVKKSETRQTGDGADSKSDNGRTGHLRVQRQHYVRTTGSPKQEATPARRRSLNITQRAGATPGAAARKGGRDAGITDGQPEGKPVSNGGSEAVRIRQSRLNGGQPMLTERTTKRLQGISQCSKNGHKVERVFQLMTNYPDLWMDVSGNIRRNKGAKTPGIDGETHATASLRIEEIRESLRMDAYRPKPARRVYIPKKNGKLRPLGIPTATDKLVQAMAARILEAIYEPIFSDHSHGFRKERSCHTALDEFKHNWTGMKWMIEADFRGCFDNINHDVLMELLAKRIDDRRFLKLIRGFLQAGYLEQWVYNRTYSGTPQGGTVSPILANIYLHELDEWLHQKACSFNRGKGRTYDPLYRKLHSRYKYVAERARELKEMGRLEEARELEPVIRERKKAYMSCPPSLTHDPNFRRMRFIRYADDFVIGIIGSKSETRQILAELTEFITRTLKVELAEEKTGIVHGSDGTRFLGYDIRIVSAKDRIVNTPRGARRSMMHGLATLEWPMENALKFALERGYIDTIANRKSRPRPRLFNLTEAEIAEHYVREMRGVSNYYSRARNWRHVGNYLHWLCQDSLIKTLASKNRVRRIKTYARLKVGNAIAVPSGTKVVQLTSTTAWKRYKTPNPDRKPRGSIPDLHG